MREPLPYRLLLDLQATQSQAHADRGVARYVKEQARSLLARGVGDALLLNPHLPFPRRLDADLLTSPLLRWATQSEVRSIAEADDRPIAYYLSSPFEVSFRAEGDLPPHLLRGDVPVATTLYDLIPLVMADRYLTEDVVARRYRARCEQLHHLDLVLTISEHTRLDALRLLDLDPAKVVNIGFGVSPFFRPPRHDEDPVALLARALPALRRPFVASVLGGDPRKNAERLFAAWGRLRAETGLDHQLVVTCGLDPATRARWETEIAGAGLAGDDVVLTGWQPDEVLRALYQCCELFVFPSLYEGAGLPPAEAMACGAAVLVSSTSSMPEVVELDEATFDPESVEAIADAIGRTLLDDELRARLVRRSSERAALLTWSAVAERTIDALRRLPAPTGPTRLPTRLALVGPMPPTASGIADYNARLLPALLRRCEVDVFSPSPRPADDATPSGLRWFPPTALKGACSPWAYDAVVYTVGNSDDHHDLYDLAQEFPGLLWLHDVRLPGLFLTYAHDRFGDEEDRKHFLYERLMRQYRRRLPMLLRHDVDRVPTEYVEHGVGMTKELVDIARTVVVSSSVAARLLALDQQPDARIAGVEVLPLAVPPAWGDGVGRAPAAAPLLACFGMVAPVKGAEVLIRTLALLRAAGVDATLALVGPVGDGYRSHLGQLADAHGVGRYVQLTGRVDDGEYRRWLSRATLAVQLRLDTNGESSAAVTDCLAAGIPTVTNVAAATELPPGTVDLVPWDVDAGGLAGHLQQLLGEPARLDALAAGGHAFARSWGFDDVAAALLGIIARLHPARPA